jgi:hypothetical protein
MRTGIALRAAALVAAATCVALSLVVRSASAGEARRALDEANAAVYAAHPAPDVARSAAERAVAAGDDPDAVAEALLRLGQLDEEDGAFMRALDRDRACVAAAPQSRWAVRAADRIDWLRARSEGDFAPLAALERVRRDPALADDPRAVAALAEQAAGFPPGRVRVEARLLVAEAWLGRLSRPDDAIAQLRQVESDPEADPLSARLAEREIVDADLAKGALDDAANEAREHASRLDPRFVAHVQRFVRRRAILAGAVGAVVLFLALAAAAIVRAALRGALRGTASSLRSVGPIAAAFAAYVAMVGGALASRYEAGTATPFLWLGVTLVPLVLCARAWSAVGATNPYARVGRALVSGASVVAAAFVLLDLVDPAYLEGFGL